MDAIRHLSTIFDQSAPSPNPNPTPSPRVILAAHTTPEQPPRTTPVPPTRVPPVTPPVPPPRVPPHALRPRAQHPVMYPVPSPRVTSCAPHPHVQPHVIDPDQNIDNVVDEILPPCYALWSHRPIPDLANRSPHYIAASLQSKPMIPAILPHTSAHHITSTRLLLAAEACRCAPSANAVIDKVTGKSLDYRHLITGPNKGV